MTDRWVRKDKDYEGMGPPEIVLLGSVVDPYHEDNRADDWVVYYEVRPGGGVLERGGVDKYAPKTGRRSYIEKHFKEKPKEWKVGKKYKGKAGSGGAGSGALLGRIITVLAVDGDYVWVKREGASEGYHFTLLARDREDHEEVSE